MDKKAIIVVSICFVLLLGWYPMVLNKYNRDPIAKPAASETNRIGAAQEADTADSVETGAEREPVRDAAAAPSNELSIPSSEDEILKRIETKEAVYTFTSHGGGIKTVELKNHSKSAGCDTDDAVQSEPKLPVSLNEGGLPLFSLLGGGELQGNGVYRLEEIEGGMRLTKSLENGLTVTKEILVRTNFLLTASLTFSNATTGSLGIPAQDWVMGTAVSSGNRSDRFRTKVFWFDGEDTDSVSPSWFENKTLGCIPGTPRSQYDSGAKTPVWSAANSQFFTMAAMPQGNGSAPAIRAHPVNLPSQDPENPGSSVGVQSEFVYGPAVLDAGQSIVREVDLYAGPKEYKTLAKLGSERSNELDLIMDFGFFGIFSKILLLSMNLLHSWGLAYGLAIVVITIIIKMLFWPLTRASTRSMKRMAAFQPQMKEIQEKYKEDPRKMNQKMMEFMKENKVNPLGGCLPMLIQIPVFMGFFFMIQSAIELRGASFLWACDLSQPDTLFRIPGFDFPVNLFPILMGATQIWQMRLTPPSPGMDPMQQKMMQYMPLIFVVFLYNFSSGLTLYWTVQNLLSILQMKLTKNEPVPAKAPGGSAKAAAKLPASRRKKRR